MPDRADVPLGGRGAATLLEEIRDGAVAEDVPVTTLLRKSRVLAARLGHQPLEQWVDNELDGYPTDAPLPDYRGPFPIQMKGDFVNSARIVRSASIPVQALPDGLSDTPMEKYFRDPIGDLEELAGNPETMVKFALPGNLAPHVRLYERMDCHEIWGEIPTLAFKNVVNQVRNRLLTFAIEIEKENPDAGEADPGSEPVAEEKVAAATTTIIYGGTNAVAVASPGVVQTVTSGIIAGDLAGLLDSLKALGVSAEDLEELTEAVEGDAEEDQDEGIGSGVKTWLGKMAVKAATEAWELGSATGANVLALAIAQYYGIT